MINNFYKKKSDCIKRYSTLKQHAKQATTLQVMLALTNQSLRNQEIQLQERNIYANYIAHLPKHEGTSYNIILNLRRYTSLQKTFLFDRGYFKGIGSLISPNYDWHRLYLQATPCYFSHSKFQRAAINYGPHDHAIKIWQPNVFSHSSCRL